MKQDVITVLLSQKLQEFLESKELAITDLHKIRKTTGEEFRAIIKDRENGMLNPQIRFLC